MSDPSALFSAITNGCEALEKQLDAALSDEAQAQARTALLELKGKVLELRESFLSQREEILSAKDARLNSERSLSEARERITDLEVALDEAKNIKTPADEGYELDEDGLYYKDKRPFCPRCQNKDHKWVQMFRDGGAVHRRCPICDFMITGF